MNSKHWIAVQIQHDNGKMDALIIPVTSLDNIASKLQIRGIVSANIFSTLTAARDVVLAWRDGFRAAGVYFWDTMPDGSPEPF
jgi:hypothetical protein